jgi:[ribosomal protein S18]-alanine N-acetyltransferase
VNIRPATLADIPSILSVERTSDKAAHWGDNEYRNVFSAGSVPRIVLVAEDKQVVGFVVVRTIGPEWEIENVAVSADARRRGIGVALIKAVASQAQHRGAEALILEVRASNEAARALYERAGFTQSGQRKDYYANPTEDAIHYRLDVRSGLSSAP